MNFWDASAVVPLLSAEPATPVVREVYRHDANLLVWWGTGVECVSAISRREREGLLPADRAREALARLDALALAWIEIAPTEQVRSIARRLLRVHPLRAADGLQLGAAVVAAENRPGSLSLLSLDERLSDAARREGFAVLDVD